MVQMLVSAFLEYVSNHRECYGRGRAGRSPDTMPLPRGICRILYTLCKVRGEKVISQLLNNEAKHLDSMALALQDWNGNRGTTMHDASDTGQERMGWEEKYVMLLWLSHLMLTPFDLESISSLEETDVRDEAGPCPIAPSPPPVVRMIASCAQYLSSPGREREAARLVLVRLTLRPDMRQYQLLDTFMKWSLSHFKASPDPARSIYTYVGILSFLNGIVGSHEKGAVAPYVNPIFELVQDMVAQESITAQEVYSSALGRKLLVKLFRSITLQTLRNDSSADLWEDILEATVNQLLHFLADKDTPVRSAASKALGAITMALDPSSATDIVEAVISGLEENVLWEDRTTGQVVGHDDIMALTPGLLKRNLTAVSPLHWHGLVLTLSYLIYRRSAPAEQLSSILNSLILALGFEQRSSSGSSTGTSVRDAACFGMWALARRYTTEELKAVNLSAMHVVKESPWPTSVLRILSCELLAAATLDSSGNIRRGASAALQELVGRHPDTIIQGIRLIQIVDYQAVSLRSRAMVDVAVEASGLDQLYEQSIIEGLLGWRGVGSPDAPSRRSAASAIGLIAASRGHAEMETITAKVVHELQNVQSRQVEVRHGLLFSVAMIIREAGFQSTRSHHSATPLKLNVTDHWSIFRSGCALPSSDLKVWGSRADVTAEAACTLLSALSLEAYAVNALAGQPGHIPSSDDLDAGIDVLNRSLLLAEENVVKVASSAATDLFGILDRGRRESLVQSWANPFEADASRGSSAGSPVGHLVALGAVAHHVSASVMVHTILATLLRQVTGSTPIESKVAAAQSLSTVLMNCKSRDFRRAPPPPPPRASIDVSSDDSLYRRGPSIRS